MCQWALVSKMFKRKYGSRAIVVVQLQQFHLEGKFLPKINFGVRKEKKKEVQYGTKLEGNWKEIGRKLEGNLIILKENGRKF